MTENLTIRGYYGIGIYHGKSEVNIGTLMRSAVSFGASFIFTVGRRYQIQASDTLKSTRQIPCYNYLDIEQLMAHLPHACRLVGIELADGAREVGNYCHPHNCIYMLGAEDHGIPPKDMAKCHEIITIPGGTYCHNVAVSGAIVMFDRHRYFNNRPLVRAAA